MDQQLEDFSCPAAEYEISIMCMFITTAEGLIRSNCITLFKKIVNAQQGK
jgi:hypothetical protein